MGELKLSPYYAFCLTTCLLFPGSNDKNNAKDQEYVCIPVTFSLVVVSRSVMSDSCVPMDCSQPGSSVHGISQARILE